MDLKIGNGYFIVTGASSGLGYAVARGLLNEGARVLGVARREAPLLLLSDHYPGQVNILTADVTSPDTIHRILQNTDGKTIDGIFVNAGGPPAKSVAETTMDDWDAAYHLLLRWKVQLIKSLLPHFVARRYGRILFSESSTLKQPVENLVLSNALRLAVAGFAKTLSEEYADMGITVNVIGPGYHNTDAVNRLFSKKSENEGISFEEARLRTVQKIKTGHMGDPEDFASLALWLLSPLSRFVTGQIYCLDGGAVKSTL